MPTREGTAVLLLAAALFLMATNLMSGLLFVLDALLVSLLGVGAATSFIPLHRMAAARRLPVRGSEGAPLSIEVTLTPSHHGRFITVDDGWPSVRGRALVSQVSPRTPVSATITVTPPRRGYFEIGPIELASRGTVGLFTGRRRIDVKDRVTIWPQVRPVPAHILDQLAPALDGRAAPVRSRQADDLYGVREYQPGDSLARIHWRTSARAGALVVREFEQMRAPAAAIVLDLDGRQRPARLDAGARAAASLLRAAFDRGLDVALVAWDDGLVEHRRWETAMDWLACAVPHGPPVAEVLVHLGALDRPLIVIAASAGLSPSQSGVIPIVPADDLVSWNSSWSGLVYTPDGMVQAW